MRISKEQFIKSLAATLRLAGEDIVDLELVDDGDTVIIHFEGGYTKRANIAMDSHLAIIRDVTKNL